MSPLRVAIALVVGAFIVAGCSSADDQAADVVATPVAASTNPLPTTPPIATAAPTPTIAAVPAPTLQPTPVQVEIPEVQCGGLVRVEGFESPFRGSCDDSLQLWASAETDGEVVTVHATSKFSSYVQHTFQYPDGLIRDEDFWPDAPGIVKLYADGDSYVAAVGHVAEGCCFVFVEMSFPARLVRWLPADSVHEGVVVDVRGLRGSAALSSSPEWAQGTYFYTDHYFEQIADRTWRVEVEPTAYTNAWDPESNTPSGQYWVGPVAAGPVGFPVDVANDLSLVDHGGGRVSAFVRPGVLEVVPDPEGDQGISATVEKQEWKWFFGEWLSELPDLGRELPSTLLVDFTDAWTRGDWEAMKTMSTEEVLAVAQARYDPDHVGAEAGSILELDDHWQCAQSRDDCPYVGLGWLCDAAAAACNGEILYATDPEDYSFIFGTRIEMFESGFVVTELRPAGDTG